MHVTIRLFARLRELAGASELTREIADGSTALDVWNGLTRDFPLFADYTTAVSVAVNEEYARLHSSVRDGDDIAFLPPVSGGCGAANARRDHGRRTGGDASGIAC